MIDKTAKTEKVTFELPKGRTHTHRGVIYKNGDVAEIDPRDKAGLERAGVLAGSRKG